MAPDAGIGQKHCDFGRAMASRYMQAFENFRILSIQKMQIPATRCMRAWGFSRSLRSVNFDDWTLTELAAGKKYEPPIDISTLHAHMPSGLQHPPSPNP
jgi:hypothetical protein